jgi:cobalt/nickel transport system ATP-binding protein
MVLLIATTPYPDVFAALGKLLPRLVADALFVTYRALFLLLEELGHALTVLRLRGGLRPDRPVASSRNVARTLGMLLVRSIDLSERLYQVLQVRGYRGRITATSRWRAVCREDVLPLAGATALLGVSLVAVLWPALWAEVSGYVLVASALPLASMLFARGAGAPSPNGGSGAAAAPARSDPRPLPALHTHDPSCAPTEVARVSCVRHVYPDGTEVSLCGLDFVAHAGEGVVVLGPNGAGKSTLLHHLLGLLRPDEGVVCVLGHDPASEFSIIQPRVGVLAQNVDEQLLGPTVYDDVAFGARNAGWEAPRIDAAVERVIARLGIGHLSGKVVHYLSGGEKRKVALAGALVTDPEILILDEPFEGLDPRSRGELVDLLCRLRAERGVTIILTTHDVDLVPRLADTVYVLAEGGHIIARGTPEEVFRRAEILKVSSIEAPALMVLFNRLRDSGVDLGSPTDLEHAVSILVEAIGSGRETAPGPAASRADDGRAPG